MVCSRHIATDEIADLTAFPKYSHSSRLLQLEGGLHSGIAASLCVNLCTRLQTEWPEMISERAILAVLE